MLVAVGLASAGCSVSSVKAVFSSAGVQVMGSLFLASPPSILFSLPSVSGSVLLGVSMPSEMGLDSPWCVCFLLWAWGAETDQFILVMVYLPWIFFLMLLEALQTVCISLPVARAPGLWQLRCCSMEEGCWPGAGRQESEQLAGFLLSVPALR